MATEKKDETPTIIVETPANESSGKSETPKLADISSSILGDDKATAKGASPAVTPALSITDDVTEDDEDDEDDETVIEALSKEVDKLKKKVFERKQKCTKKRRTTPKPKSRAWTLFG